MNGVKKEENIQPKDKQEEEEYLAFGRCDLRVKIITKITGVVGSLFFVALAYLSFSTAWNDCSSVLDSKAIAALNGGSVNEILFGYGGAPVIGSYVYSPIFQ